MSEKNEKEEEGMTPEQYEVWVLKFESGRNYTAFDEHRITFWKRFNQHNLFNRSERSCELLMLAYHQVGEKEPLMFFESSLIKIETKFIKKEN